MFSSNFFTKLNTRWQNDKQQKLTQNSIDIKSKSLDGTINSLKCYCQYDCGIDFVWTNNNNVNLIGSMEFFAENQSNTNFVKFEKLKNAISKEMNCLVRLEIAFTVNV